MITGIFEVYNTTNATMVNHVKDLLYLFGLLDKVITHVKYERSILSTFTCALTFVIFCSTLKNNMFVKCKVMFWVYHAKGSLVCY